MATKKSVTTRWDPEVLERTDAAVAKAPRKTDRTKYFHEAVVDKLEAEGEVSFTEAQDIRRRI